MCKIRKPFLSLALDGHIFLELSLSLIHLCRPWSKGAMENRLKSFTRYVSSFGEENKFFLYCQVIRGKAQVFSKILYCEASNLMWQVCWFIWRLEKIVNSLWLSNSSSTIVWFNTRAWSPCSFCEIDLYE